MSREVPEHKKKDEWKPVKITFRDDSASKSKPPFRCNRKAEIPDY